jgi:acyl-CoA synthetase (AMP-forming)/AMP-acid ligase II
MLNLIKQLFRCDHKPVQCSVLENTLLKHPLVVDCGAFAKVCPNNGEVPAAWVVLKSGSLASKVTKYFPRLPISLA